MTPGYLYLFFAGDEDSIEADKGYAGFTHRIRMASDLWWQKSI